MLSTSKSNRRRKAKKSKFVPKPKQRWQVKQPKRNCLELPSDIMANILYRVGVYDILENAQKVCTTWRKICKDPALWRVISMHNHGDPRTRPPLREMCKHAVNRSQGQLLDLTIIDFVDYELLEYVAESVIDSVTEYDDLQGRHGGRCTNATNESPDLNRCVNDVMILTDCIGVICISDDIVSVGGCAALVRFMGYDDRSCRMCVEKFSFIGVECGNEALMADIFTSNGRGL
ncbi:putative F-box/LRR-repeat protein 23 [Tanacetum coccineum]